MQDILKGIAYLRKKKPSDYNYADLLFLGRLLDKVENYINDNNHEPKDITLPDTQDTGASIKEIEEIFGS